MNGNIFSQKIDNLDDESFRKLLLSLAGATGIPAERILEMDIPKIKKMLSSMNNEQLNRLLSSFGAKDLENIKKMLSK